MTGSGDPAPEPLAWPPALVPAPGDVAGRPTAVPRAAAWPSALLAGHRQPPPTSRRMTADTGGRAGVGALRVHDADMHAPHPAVAAPASTAAPHLGWEVEVGLEPYAALLAVAGSFDAADTPTIFDVVLKACSCVLRDTRGTPDAALDLVLPSPHGPHGPHGPRVGALPNVASASIAAIARARAAASPPCEPGALTVVDATGVSARAFTTAYALRSPVLIVGPVHDLRGAAPRLTLSATGGEPGDAANIVIAVQHRLEQPLQLLYLE